MSGGVNNSIDRDLRNWAIAIIRLIIAIGFSQFREVYVKPVAIFWWWSTLHR